MFNFKSRIFFQRTLFLVQSHLTAKEAEIKGVARHPKLQLEYDFFTFEIICHSVKQTVIINVVFMTTQIRHNE